MSIAPLLGNTYLYLIPTVLGPARRFFFATHECRESVIIKGLRLIGYNSATKQCEASWIYSMSTAIMTMTGTRKEEGKPIEWTASFKNDKGEQQAL
jgi:hypothetical protein